VEKIKFAVEKFDIIDENPDSRFLTAKIQAFSSGENLHNMTCSEDVLKSTAPTIEDIPIIYNFPYYNKADFGTHTDSEHSLICGWTVPNTVTFERLSDKRLSLNVLAKISKRYASKVVDILKKDDGNTGTSVEMDLTDSEELPNTLLDMKNFIYQSDCLLGRSMQAASPGSHLQVLSFAKENAEIRDEYMEEFSDKYSSLDLSIPETVKESVKLGLDLYSKYGKGGTSVSLALAHHLAKNDKASHEKIRHMAKVHKSNKFVDMDEKNISDNYITFLLYGGNEAKDWSISINDALEKIDNTKRSYFEKVTFPYSKLEQVNPAIRGIDPPVDLEQANEIARAADAIGVSKDKNGWAISIGNFKRNHIVKDDHWIEKDAKMSDNEVKESEKFADNGTGETITVDKSKESMSDTGWGSVDKTALMHKVLNAKNYKSLVNDIYAKVDAGWEDHPSSGLHYPIMQIVGNKAVYNRGGLTAALQRAEGQNETSVVSKVNGIYGKLGLDKPEKEVNNSMEDVKYEKKINEAVTKKMAAEKPEEGSAEEEKTETPVEEKKEDADQQKTEKEQNTEKKPTRKEKMSLDANLDVEFLLEMLEEETENEADWLDSLDDEDDGDTEANYALMCKMCSKMATKMAKMSADSKTDKDAYMAENGALKEFKASIESKQFSAEVETLLSEVLDVMPKKEIDEAREDAKNFSLETIDAWKNKTKALAFSFTKTTKPKDGITRIANPWKKEEKTQDSLWKRLGN